jgi:hypothetical protein
MHYEHPPLLTRHRLHSADALYHAADLVLEMHQGRGQQTGKTLAARKQF